MKMNVANKPGLRSGKGTGVASAVLLMLAVLLSGSVQGTAQKAQSASGTMDNVGSMSSLPPADKGRSPLEKNPVTLPAAMITDVQATREGEDLVISILADRLVSHEEFMLSKPSRLVVDFVNVESKIPFFKLPLNAARVKQLRIRQFQSTDPKIARMVFDLEEVHGKHEIHSDNRTVRIVFHEAEDPQTQGSDTRNLIASGAAVVPAEKNHSVPEPARDRKPILEQNTVPVINDLSTTEIPLSALAAGISIDLKPRQTLPPVKETSPVPAQPVPAPPVTPPRPVMTMTAPVDGKFSGFPLTLDLIDIPLVDFFRLMAEEGGINIVMDPEIKGTISIKVVKVPWDQIFDAALMNNGLDKQVEGNLVRIARKATLQDEAKQRESLKKANLLAADLETRIKRLNYAKAASFVGPLTDQKTVRGTVVVDDRTNALIVTDIPASLDKMLELVESLDIPQPQVEIEARIVSATRDFARDIGVQFGFVQGNLERVTLGGPNTFGTIGGTRPTATPISTFAGGNTARGRGAADNTSSQSAGVSTGTGSNNAGNLNVNLPAQKAFGGVGISVGNIFDTFLLDAAITAGESKGLAKLISQPKVTAQNNHPASITQGLRFPVQIIANNTITVQFQNAALTLTVTPQITVEGNIVLDLKVENNTPDFSRSVNGIPSIRTSESATRVLVSDGGTTVIGGILMDNETTQEERIPGLASLPIVGNIFKRSAVSRSVQEVLFFITPRIVK